MAGKRISRLTLYAHAWAAPAQDIKNTLLAAIESNREITITDLLPPLKCNPETFWPNLFTDSGFITDVEAWIHQMKTLLSYRISEITGCTKLIGEIIASFIYPEWHEASRYNIVFVGARNFKIRGNLAHGHITSKRLHKDSQFFLSCLYAWEGKNNDFRSHKSTYVCVKDLSSLTLKKKENAMWRLRPAGVDKHGVEVFWIQQVGSRAPGKVNRGYLHAWERRGNMDYRDAGSTRLCVHENMYHKSCLFRILDAGNNNCRIQLVGKRKRGRRRGPTFHVWEGYTQDQRDEFSTYACVHDSDYGTLNLWRLSLAE